MLWTYSQLTGVLSNNGGVSNGYTFSCYSGNGLGKNNPSMQAVEFTGPIPCGLYDMGDPEDSPEHGPYAIPLVPRGTNQMFGRSGFMLHGERREGPSGCASEGCIIHSPETDREVIYQSHLPIEVIP